MSRAVENVAATDGPSGLSDELARLRSVGVLAVRRGPGANCSSIGSVVDLLFATAVIAGVLYGFVATALPDRPPDEGA